MSQTLGEKLRQAREEKGLGLADVAEQTRISSLYLEAIENDDYKILPGGIFNKGFIKSYAKFVGINEQEALIDYQANLARTEGASAENDQKVYKPEVLTDDGSGSMVKTLIVAALVLALLTGGILYVVKYLRGDGSSVASSVSKPVNTTANDAPPGNTIPETPSSGVPDMASLVVDVKAGAQPVKIIATVDAEAAKPVNIAAGSSTTFNPKQSLTLNYLRWNSTVVSMSINGKEIRLPSQPLDAKDKDRIVFTISAETLPQIWNSGSIGSLPVSADQPAQPPAETTTQKPAATATPKPAANTAATPAKPPANTAPKPPANTAKPPTMMTTTKPTPKPNE